MTLFDRVFGGNDYNYARTVAAIDAAIDQAIATYGEAEPVAFPNTAYNLPCYYSITGKKINNLGELKAAMENDIKPMMTRNARLQDAFDSGVASALCAEFLEVLKYLGGAEPYAEPEMGFLTDAFVRNLGLPLVTGDIPGVAVIIGGAEDLLGMIHYNMEIMDADRQGKSPYDFSPTAIEEIRKIKAILDRDET